MSDDYQGATESVSQSENRPPVPIQWKFSDRFWRLSQRLTPKSVNYYLRLRSAKSIPHNLRARFTAMLIPAETIDRALSEVHRLDDWVGAWSRAAQRFMAESRREETAGDWEASAVARRNAAMCYHAAHLVTEDDPRIVRALRASAVQAFSQAITRLVPGTRRVSIPWRTRRLPAYLSIPHDAAQPAPLIVMLNGATTTKEETFLWSDGFLSGGFAILALDWPGTGEATDGQQLSSYCDDMTDGIFALAAAEPAIDEESVAFLGISLGGVVAIRAAATDRRIGAVIAVTPPYDPRPWVNSINPLVAQQLVSLAGQAPSVPVLIADFSLPDVVGRVRCPALVFGAARDLVVPPDESMKLTSAFGELGTLVWYADGSHALYDRVDDWTAVAAEWLATLFELPALDDEDGADIEDSTQVDAASPPGEDTVVRMQVAREPDRELEPVDLPEGVEETEPDAGHQSERPPIPEPPR